ncbi:MAG: methionine--tRNA ligase [Candidatus Colwellbacteria bacterium]|nr:methionine--tRNA ligase [Candidatus Colwellbacteria bacterium]
MMARKFYITTTLPYVNAPPHIGFALEIVRADALARWRRLMGDEVFFNTGTDEHGLKIYRAAQKEGKDPQAYADEYAAKFDQLKQALDLSYDNFIRTTDPHHVMAAQEFWQRCDKNGDIYKKLYQIKYCVECELEKTESELENGRCLIHPQAEIELIDEENYFFKFSRYQDKLLDFYESHPDFVVPAFRLNEIKKFVEAGLQDFSISRLKEKMPWGISVPGDDKHVMYVWFDALVNYISALGWPEDEKKFEEFWGTKENPNAIQIAGKDNLRQQSAMWQAMLMSAGLPTSRQIYIEGFITSHGQKMSKSLGNVIDPIEIVKKYGTDSIRYYLLRHVNPFEDSDVTEDTIREAYNAHLANGLGNLVSRIMKMASSLDLDVELPKSEGVIYGREFQETFKELENYEFNGVADNLWVEISRLDAEIQAEKPFNLIESDPKKARKIIADLVLKLWYLAISLEPLMPETSLKIQELIQQNKAPEKPLFLRLD